MTGLTNRPASGDTDLPQPVIRPARADEYDEVARIWMESWVSTGLEDASNFLLAKLRARSDGGRKRLEPLRRRRQWKIGGDAGDAFA
jgi:hypothetical protein